MYFTVVLRPKIWTLFWRSSKTKSPSLKGYGMNILGIRGKNVRFSDNMLIVELEDGRIIGTPISWYKPLQEAKLSELNDYHFICDNTGIEWENLDYHLSIISMLQVQTKVS